MLYLKTYRPNSLRWLGGIVCGLFWAIALVAQTPAVTTPQTAPPPRGGVGIAPAVAEVYAKRGTTITQTFTLDNSTAARVRFRCSTGDFWYNAENQLTFGPAGTKERSAALWVQFLPTEIIAEPYSSVTVKALVTIPADARGGYYLTPIFTGEAAPQTDNTPQRTPTASLAVELTGLMLIGVEDAADYRLAVLDGAITPPTANSELTLKAKIANQGTIHARVRGAFALLDVAGKVVGRGKIEPRTFLPGQSLELSGSWAGTLPAGSYTALATFTYNRVGQTPATVVQEWPFRVVSGH